MLGLRTCLPLAAALLLAACGSQPAVPDGHSGPVAIIRDSGVQQSPRKADAFYLTELDGRRVESSRDRTERANQGAGFSMNIALIARNVPAGKPVQTRIVARTLYAAPILALTNDVYQVTGVVEFTPEPYRTYVVRGELGERMSAVWLEDEANGTVVGQKVVVQGSAKLGFGSK